MNEEQRDYAERIECHDGWHLYLYAATCFVHDANGVEGIAFSRGSDNQIDVPVEDIPALIAALQRFVESGSR